MKPLIFFFSLLFPLLASAQTNGVRHHRDFIDPKKPNRTGEIQGRCVVQAGEGNLIPTPCAEVVLILNGTGKDNEPISTRTDRAGSFLFSTAIGQSYKVKSGSKFYEVVEPSTPVRSGDTVQVVLKQK